MDNYVPLKKYLLQFFHEIAPVSIETCTKKFLVAGKATTQVNELQINLITEVSIWNENEFQRGYDRKKFFLKNDK